MDRERVEEAREDEAAAAQARLRARTLVGAVSEAMASGDSITVSCGDRSWTGRVTAVGGDHALVTGSFGRVAVNLAGPIRIARVPSPSGGTAGDASHGSFRARLATAELSGDRVEIVTPAASVVGVLSVVATDHVILVDDGVEAWVPLPRVGVVVLA